MVRVLLVEDDPAIRTALTRGLAEHGHVVVSASTGAQAVAMLSEDRPDVIVLDLGLPDIDGKDVIRHLREWSEAPIIVLSAREQESEKVAALDAGADDYVNKPVSIDELMARLRASLRGRERRFGSEAIVRAQDLEIDFALRRTTIEGIAVKLSQREYDLLRTLARHAGRVVTHRQIIAAVWGAGAQVDSQSVRVLVAQLRQKIEAEPSSPKLLLNEPGVGYRLRG